tara:strand:+ start:370 stop:630 length:261 start_codon:yes stop_codon:yes gene_type:complete
MNYCIVTSEVFDTLNKEIIQYSNKSLDESKYIVVTTETIDTFLTTFSDAPSLLTYTLDNISEWEVLGDASGVEEWSTEEMEWLSAL